jgi:serine/threonine protein kinase
MNRLPQFSDFGIVDTLQFNPSKFTIPLEALPKQRIDGKIYSAGTIRCKLSYGTIINQGRFGLIQRCTRSVGLKEEALVVKRPRNPIVSLVPEAFMQSICSQVLATAGFPHTVPKVFDIFVFADEVRFSMEWIAGCSLLEFLDDRLSQEGDELFLNCILQVSCILYVLEKELGFDHRDLKPDNLWVQNLAAPIKYRIQLGGVSHEFTILHRIVLLDFGFSCVGTGDKMLVNLGDAIPDMDSCPKDGRDMYHLLNRLLTHPTIKRELSRELHETIRSWMHPYEIQDPSLTHLMTANVSFSIQSLKAERIIQWYFSRE